MLIVVVVAFALSWLPLHLLNIIVDFAPPVALTDPDPENDLTFYGIFYACHWLAMANNFMNPLIYNFMNDHFKVSANMLLKSVMENWEVYVAWRITSNTTISDT